MGYEAVAGCPRTSRGWDTPQIKEPANGVVKGGVLREIKISLGRNDSEYESNDEHVNAMYRGPSNFVCDIRRGVGKGGSNP